MDSSAFVVCHPMEWESLIEGGVKTSTRQQRTALDRAGITYTTDPSEDYDVLHLNFPGPRSLASFAGARRRGRPVVIHAHSIGENIADTYRLSGLAAPLLNRYFTALYARADAAIAVSPFMRDRLHANGVDGNVVVVSNGVDGASLDGHADRDTAARFGLTRPAVINLAQVYEIKGVADFVAVGRSLPETDFAWFGPKHRYLSPRSTKRTVRRAPRNVSFPGFVQDKRDALAAGDIFFFPTHRDNQPLSILEAAYCGLPIVTRDIPAFEGWLDHEVHCLKGSSVREFRDHITRLRDDAELRRRLGENAHELAVAHSMDHVGERLRTVYETVLDQDPIASIPTPAWATSP